MRLVRLGPQLARAVVQREDGSPEVLSFDPSEAQPTAASTPLPFDVVLDTAHEDGALYVYGLRLGIAADGGPTDQTALFLASVDDTTGALTTRSLTSPGAVATPKTYQYEPPLGRFVRFGDDDVYFTYTEEVGFANNPSYRLSVGRVTASSGPVTMTVAETADAHKFEAITATGIVHAGTNVHVFMGGSVVSNDSDDFDSAGQWTLPDDGTVPANIQKRGHSPGLLAAGRDGSMFRFAFLEPATIFGDPRYFYFANADESSLGTFQESSTNLKFSNDTAKASSADSHMEGSQFLWFGPKHGFWFDTSSGQVRATFGPMNPSNGISSAISIGAVTLASEPTLDSGTVDALFATSDSDGTSLRFVELTCAR